VLRPRSAGLLIAATTAAIFFCTRHSCRSEDEHIAWMIALLGFQSFAAVAVFVGRRELEARLALASANAELRATRSLLVEASRASERARIARELHDVLGHDLTALGLQLEIATHLTGPEVGAHIEKAQEVSARLLRNVRAVVSATSSASGLDLASGLRELSRDLPGLAVHLDLPARLAVDDAVRAHCVLRCVQEVITNALRHAGAKNIWIALAQTDDGITLEARDDGCGAESVCAGNGLSGMRARLEELGGRLRVASAPRREFVVSAWLPARGAPS
jgi:signal transduction histidine kinase